MKKLRDFFVSVVVVAAGRGTRMNMDVNKQYINVGGKPILAHTLQAFEACGDIDEIVLVVNEQDIFYCKQSIIEEYGFSKVTSIVAGGSQRQESVYNGLKALNSLCEIVLIHDGARPFISQDSIRESIIAADSYGASGVAVPVKDTVKVVDHENFIRETPDRSKLWAIQTPQTFKYELIMKAHKIALGEGYLGTDDTVLVERLGASVKLVMGSYNNIKITTREDLLLAEIIARDE